MQSYQIYFLAGLGFDFRIFENLVIENCEVKYLHWLEPDKNESLESYVKRIAGQIEISDKPLILAGHSFGGIIVQEMSKIVNAKKVVIISSIKSKDEIPFTLNFLKVLPLYKFFNQKLILATFPIWARAFGYNSEKGRALFVQMIQNCSDNYFKWSLDKIVNWQGNENWRDVIHIHGTRDKTFFISKIKHPIVIEDGSHFMVFSKADEVGDMLNREINNL